MPAILLSCNPLHQQLCDLASVTFSENHALPGQIADVASTLEESEGGITHVTQPNMCISNFHPQT